MEPRRVTFISDHLQLVGHLYVPAGAQDQPTPAIVFTGPFTGVKEQVTGNYARRLAEAGFVTLALDHRNFGESEGTPRQHEDVQGKLTDLRDAISFLSSLPEVDPARIGACGICLGGSFALPLAAIDPRVKALVTIAAVYLDPIKRRERMGNEAYRAMLAHLASVAQHQFETSEIEYMPAVTEDGKGAAMAAREPWEYYGTARSYSPHWVNRVTVLSETALCTYNAAYAASLVSPTPFLVIHGRTDLFAPPEAAAWVYEQAGEPKDIFWLPTSNHIDLYDQEEYVAPAAARAAEWFTQYLGGVNV
jgi:fermentation-respiration switch protein FrsA (DUF1100 family)